MVRAWEPEFIRLWQAGATQAQIAQALGIPQGTVKSRAHRLQQQGKIQARPRGGDEPSRSPGAHHPGPTPERPPSTVHPATVDPATWEMRQLKHSERWTIYVPRTMREEIKRRAEARKQNPSILVQEALRRYLAEEDSS
jgi:DNA-binding transcriptional MocR family regulator